jgi:hypothetical protein
MYLAFNFITWRQYNAIEQKYFLNNIVRVRSRTSNLDRLKLCKMLTRARIGKAQPYRLKLCQILNHEKSHCKL